MTEDAPQAAEAAPETQTAADEADVLATLQQENLQLRAEIDQLGQAQSEASTQQERLADAEAANEQLRHRYASVAMRQALAEAAANVGLAPEAAGAYAHRFRCEIDADGATRVEPNPTEFLLQELKDNPLLRQSVERARQERSARAVASGAAEVGQADPVELLASLDRNPARKAQFIRRHGTAGYVDLARRARRKGYGRTGS